MDKLYFVSHACDNLCLRAIVLMSCDISPLWDVAQTSDCGVYSFLTFDISPLCGVAPTPDCGIIVPHFPLEESFRHSFGTSITILQFPLEASFRPSLGTQYLLSECALLIYSYASCLHLLYLMSELSCEYFHSTHLACWFGQMLMKAISWMKSSIVSPTPRGIPVSPVRSWILVTCIIYASATHNKYSRASLRRSKSCSILESCHSLRDDISTTVFIVS